MTFRTRLLLGAALAIGAPLAVFGFGIRRGLAGRLTAQNEARVAALVSVIRADLARDSADIGRRLAALADDARRDNRLRLALLEGGERFYLLDYAGTAMRLAGLAMLQLQDSAGRIVSSGHFRNEFDRLEPGMPRLVAAAPGGMALVRARTAEAPFLALARVDSFEVGGRRFTLVGGIAMDSAALARLAPDSELTVALDTLGIADTTGAVVGTLALPLVEEDSTRLAPARIVVTHSTAGVDALRRAVDRWFLGALAVTVAIALLLAAWLSIRVSRPLTALADKTGQIDMDRLDVDFASERTDEIGALSRLLGAMTDRLRAGAARLREAERRVAMGDLARQVNHDVKNGLIPIRNVFRHLAEVARERPETLGKVFAERQGTVESGLAYLEGIASNYARLYPEPASAPCDVNTLIGETVRRLADGGAAAPRLELADSLPAVRADPLVLRRIFENLVGNALDATAGKAEGVSVSTSSVAEDGRTMVRVTVADTGKGMSKRELDQAFEGFYTTKPGGTGLGLSIVRRLVLDAGGSLKVETKPGQGTRVHVELPA
jgi:two-component system, NtrC family, nitrogen regulation sensor histidine kinase NtrY